MLRLKKLRSNRSREAVVQNLSAQSRIDLSHIAHAATQHDATRVQCVDDLGQTSGQTIHIKIKALLGP